MAMDVLDLMETRLSSFTRTDRVVYERLKKFPEEFSKESYDQLTAMLGISPSALTRFAKKLGFSGYADLQYQLALDLEQRAKRTEEATLAETFGSFLVEAERTVDADVLNEVAQHIVNARKVTCLGFNLSGLAARFLCNTITAQLNVESECPSYDFMGGRYGKGDVIILFSVSSGEWYRSLLQLIRKGDPDDLPYVVLVTMNRKHSLRRLCDSIIVLPTAGKVTSGHVAALESMLFTQLSDRLVEEAKNISR